MPLVHNGDGPQTRQTRILRGEFWASIAIECAAYSVMTRLVIVG